jgi:hypothetical protein
MVDRFIISEINSTAGPSQILASTGMASDGIGRSRMAALIFRRKPTPRLDLSKVRWSVFSIGMGTKFDCLGAQVANWLKLDPQRVAGFVLSIANSI